MVPGRKAVQCVTVEPIKHSKYCSSVSFRRLFPLPFGKNQAIHFLMPAASPES